MILIIQKVLNCDVVTLPIWDSEVRGFRAQIAMAGVSRPDLMRKNLEFLPNDSTVYKVFDKVFEMNRPYFAVNAKMDKYLGGNSVSQFRQDFGGELLSII